MSDESKREAIGVRAVDYSVNPEIVQATKEVFGRYISRNKRNLGVIISRKCPNYTIEDFLQAGTIRKILHGASDSEIHYQRNVFDK